MLPLLQHPGAVLHPGPAAGPWLLSPAPLPLHLATFHCQYGSQVTSLLQQPCKSGELWQAVSSLAALQEQYRELVEVGRGRVGAQQSYLSDSWEGLSLLQVQTLVFLIYCTLHYTPGDGAGEPELRPAAGPEGGCAEPGSGAPGCQQRGGVAGDAVPPVHLQAWREEEQEREEGTVQDWPGQSLRGWTWCWYRLGERSTPSSLSCP